MWTLPRFARGVGKFLVPQFYVSLHSSCAMALQVHVWTSVKKFCDDNYPKMSFRNDAARKAHLLRHNIRLQKDENGVEGVCIPKAGSEDTKEIKVGKRMAASKIKQQDLGDGSDYGREQIKALQASNAKHLKVESNKQDT